MTIRKEYRPWLIFVFALWFLMVCAHMYLRPTQRALRDIDVSLGRYDVHTYTSEHGWMGDGETVMQLENVVGFLPKSDDWMVYMGMADPALPWDQHPYSTISRYFSMLPQIQDGYYYLRDDSPEGTTYRNFTFAVFDKDSNVLYYLEYDS